MKRWYGGRTCKPTTVINIRYGSRAGATFGEWGGGKWALWVTAAAKRYKKVYGWCAVLKLTLRVLATHTAVCA